jgi:hypothetical protein
LSGIFSKILQQLEISDVPVSECKSRYFPRIDLQKHLCAGGIEGLEQLFFVPLFEPFLHAKERVPYIVYKLTRVYFN